MSFKETAIEVTIAVVAFMLSAGAHPGKKPSELCHGTIQTPTVQVASP